ncbi:sugar diacid recognition domain-containing protein [Robertmurraya massiliosenegalensis]|uniref:CdaR family transcriptional regulator n=1 Tax=Robertmurraya TaxID=2837507 RepID=UPI0039A71F09
MKVTARLATNIVDKMKEIINQDINYINENSIIIASTNKTRIGNYHGGAQKVLESNERLIITVENEYEGTRKGINVPIHHDNKVIGVIGITGTEEEVSKFGEIIKSMTEILIKEAFIQEQIKLESESKKQFIEDLLFRIYDDDKLSLKIRSELLDVEIDVPRIIAIARIDENYKPKYIISHEFQEEIFKLINRYIDFDKQNIMIKSGINYLLFLKAETIKDIKSLLNNISKKIEEKLNVNVYFGIGSNGINKNEVRDSYDKARKALNVALIHKEEKVVNYSELDVDLIIDDLSQVVKEKYINDVFKSIDDSQVDSYIDLLLTYFKNDGSIIKTAEELFLHKNTLQYKLKKLKKLTGYDPRKSRDQMVLYLAILVYKNMNK